MKVPGEFRNPERAAEVLPRILAREGGEAAVQRVAASADPDLALLNLARYVETVGSMPPRLGDAVTLFAGSQSMCEAAIRRPEILEDALEDPELPGRAELRARARSLVESSGLSAESALRRFVRTETLRLLVADLSGRAGLPAVAAHLSHIASAAVDEALRLATETMVGRYGAPREPGGAEAAMTVIGFGKLGGEELNYSSDIDLVFLYSAEGKTDGPDPRRVRRNREFFVKVVEETRRLLAAQTAEGHCYRVDLRLRPEGSTGALTRTTRSAVEYYRRTGRTWERQALIKARPVAGDLELGRREFVEPLADFVYGEPLTASDIRSIKELKEEIERRHRDPRQVKAGRGGIRDVEFTVQFLQLLTGRDLPEVRRTGTLPALAKLAASGAILRQDRELLEASYLFLRSVEHRLQTMHEVRTHLLPADPEGIRRLAARMGLGRSGSDPLEEFRELHARHTHAARSVLERLLHNVFAEPSDGADLPTNFVLHPDRYREAMTEWLGDRGFASPEGAAEILECLAALPPRRSRKYLASLAPALLDGVSKTPEPDRSLRNLERVIGAIGAPSMIYQLFSEYPDILGVYTDLCGWSQHLTEILVRNPALYDAFADSLVVTPRGGEQPWDDLTLGEIVNAESPEEQIHDFRDRSLLRIGVRDIQGIANTENTARDLSRLAERILGLALCLAESRIPANTLSPPPGLAILGLGKLGAREMNFASDLDLIFVSDRGGAAREHLAKVARATLRLLDRPGNRGRLYETDARVRPHGRSGPLITTLEEFERYYIEDARIAELQMLTKARPVAGDPSLRSELAETIDRILYGRAAPPGVRVEVRRMREKLESGARGRDVKRGFGGLADIEFLVEALKLLHGREHRSLRVTGTLAGHAAASREGLVGFREHETLLTAMQFFRSVESRMRILYDMALDRIPESDEECENLARRLGYVGTRSAPAAKALLDEYDYHTACTRRIFLRVLEG